MLDDTTTCYRHDHTQAAVSCQRCERPICPQCMTQASVGFHCPHCVAEQGQEVVRGRDLGQRPAPLTVALIAINAVIFLVQNQIIVGDPPGDLRFWGGLFGPGVEAGHWWRIVTAGFLHGGLIHVGFNCYALWLLGRPLEQALGSVRFGAIYLAGLLGGSYAALLFDYQKLTVGASGAVLGLASALAALFWARGISIRQTSLGGIIVFNLVLPLIIPFISFWGHFGGIAAGFAAGWLVSWLPIRYEQPIATGLAAVGALCLLLVALSLRGPIGFAS